MNKNIILVLIGDIIIVGMFIFMACFFKHWWISLCSLLFMHTYKREDTPEQKNTNYNSIL